MRLGGTKRYGERGRERSIDRQRERDSDTVSEIVSNKEKERSRVGFEPLSALALLSWEYEIVLF